jgi:hypothetical protein
MAAFPWSALGIKKTADERMIKSAYAKKLKVTRPEDDPAAFQRLVEARDVALRIAKQASFIKVQDENEFQNLPLLGDNEIETQSNQIADSGEAKQKNEQLSPGDFAEPFEEILTGDMTDIPFESIRRLVEMLRELPIVGRLEIEPRLLLALDHYFENQNSIEAKKIDTLQSSYQKYLVLLLNEEFQWSSNDRRIYELVPFLSSEFPDRLRQLMNPQYKPQTVENKRSWNLNGQLIWMALVLLVMIAKNCSNQTPFYGKKERDFSNEKQELLWRKVHKKNEPKSSWTYHVPPIGPP